MEDERGQTRPSNMRAFTLHTSCTERLENALPIFYTYSLLHSS